MARDKNGDGWIVGLNKSAGSKKGIKYIQKWKSAASLDN